MSNDEKNNLQTDGKSVATPPRDRSLRTATNDRAMRAPVEHRKPTTAEILNGPRRRENPVIVKSVEENPGD